MRFPSTYADGARHPSSTVATCAEVLRDTTRRREYDRERAERLAAAGPGGSDDDSNSGGDERCGGEADTADTGVASAEAAHESRFREAEASLRREQTERATQHAHAQSTHRRARRARAESESARQTAADAAAAQRVRDLQAARELSQQAHARALADLTRQAEEAKRQAQEAAEKAEAEAVAAVKARVKEAEAATAHAQASAAANAAATAAAASHPTYGGYPTSSPHAPFSEFGCSYHAGYGGEHGTRSGYASQPGPFGYGFGYGGPPPFSAAGWQGGSCACGLYAAHPSHAFAAPPLRQRQAQPQPPPRRDWRRPVGFPR